MNRKQFCGLAAGLLAGGIAGCGGGSGNDNQDSSSVIANPGAGSVTDLSRLTVLPTHPQSAYIGGDTRFVLLWPAATDAPRTTRVALYRFLEAQGDEVRENFREDIRIAANNASSWSVRKTGDLFPGGVFYLDVSTDLDRRRYAYIVGGGRAVATNGEPTRGVDISTPGNGSLSGMTLRFSGDATGTAGVSAATSFVLQFPSEVAAPPRFSVRLRRYKERRGTDEPSANEQKIEVAHDAGTGLWTVRRRDNFLLERGATYILEINADGEPQPRGYVFLTEG